MNVTMSTARPWTDGNWSVAPDNPRKVVSDGIDGLDPLTGESVVGGAVAGPKAEANATLIAAAPELYEALTSCIGILEDAGATATLADVRATLALANPGGK